MYLAAESPASVKSRFQGYQQYHDIQLPNVMIVKNQVNLFDGQANVTKIIKQIKMFEEKRGMKVRLVLGDTLARMSGGANENSGEDMGLIIERIDKIRAECDVHFMLIHHSGKNQEAGARGWSGILGACDSELEVKDRTSGSFVEVTKVRDFGTKGDAINFRIEAFDVGIGKWGHVVTACVILPDETSLPKASTSRSNTETAILKAVSAHIDGIAKADVWQMLKLQGEARSTVYSAVTRLLNTRALVEADQLLTISKINDGTEPAF